MDVYFYLLYKIKLKGFKFLCNLIVDWDFLNKEIYIIVVCENGFYSLLSMNLLIVFYL